MEMLLILKNGLPIVLIGAQFSSDEPSVVLYRPFGAIVTNWFTKMLKIRG